MENKILEKSPQYTSGISKVQLSDDVIKFLENFNVIWMSDNTKYYHIPYWFKSSSDKNIFNVIDIQDIISENYSLKNKLNDIKNNIK